MATDAISPATLTDSLPKHQKRPSLIIHISEAEFEDEGNFYLKFEASFWGKPADKAPRTDVSTPPTRHPIFRPDTFSFNIPEGTSEDVPSEKNNSVKVVISAIRVEKTKDGGATINKIGSHTFKSRDLRLLEGKKTEVQTTLLSDTVPGFPAKPVGQIRLILSLDLDSDHEDFVASAAAQPNGPRISLWNRKNEVDEVQERITKKDEKYSMFINEHTKTDGQKVVVFIHFIYNLPPLTNLGNGQISLPSPFISIKTAKEAATNIRAKLVTNTAKPGTAASYAEKFIIKFEQPYTSQNPSEIPEIFISILDETSKRYIAKFNIPIAAIHFPSHRQVNLVLRSVSTVHKEITPCLRISVRNEDCSIGSKRLLQREYSRAMIFLEAYLKGVNKALPVDARYIAALRISHHSADYAAKMTALQSRFQKSCPTSFPQLQPAAQLDFDSNGTMISDYPLSKDAPIPYLIYDKTQQSSSKLSKGDSLYYQMTLATSFTSTPAWNEHFLFFIDLASFSHDTALIIELYKDPQLSESSSKTAPPAIDDIMAYAIVPLGDFSIISNTETQLVVNVDDIALTFIGQYENMSGTDNITLSIDFKVPENWVRWQLAFPMNVEKFFRRALLKRILSRQNMYPKFRKLP
ncbi:hypothetical protein BC830DRAFT_887272 [Chytriomyces sp. MP71]|nr:hypothetical protein BC830DRAFT_887272 [Chytriomyces sp. MP71]